MGATIALPFLDAMYPAFASQAVRKSLSANRMAFLYVPNGIVMEDWTPAGGPSVQRRSASCHAFPGRSRRIAMTCSC